MIEEHADGALRLTPGRIARVQISNPARRNAIGLAMWQVLPVLCARLAGDAGLRVVILGADPEGGAFSAGADISEFAQTYATADSTAAYNAAVRAAQGALRDLPCPVIAEVAGACYGGGCGLALSCDLRFAAASARFAITPARLGLAYSWEDTATLVEKVGPARAKDMLFSGRALAAGEALAIGLIDRVFADDALAAETLAYAESLAALSPASIRVAKAMVNRLTQPDPAGRAEMQAAYEATFAGPDFAEGRAAFLERRPPRFGDH
jgi:enoyl-CoA hydratase/carnithine racemase